MEKNLKKCVCVCVYNWITLLYNWNTKSTILQINKKKKQTDKSSAEHAYIVLKKKKKERKKLPSFPKRNNF